MDFTLTQILAQRDALKLYGTRLSDLQPRGDLGLGLDPEGPVGFALIRACTVAGRGGVLAAPLILSVFGSGEAPAADDGLARPGERVWAARQGDAALLLEVRRGSLLQLLQGAAAGPLAGHSCNCGGQHHLPGMGPGAAGP